MSPINVIYTIYFILFSICIYDSILLLTSLHISSSVWSFSYFLFNWRSRRCPGCPSIFPNLLRIFKISIYIKIKKIISENELSERVSVVCCSMVWAYYTVCFKLTLGSRCLRHHNRAYCRKILLCFFPFHHDSAQSKWTSKTVPLPLYHIEGVLHMLWKISWFHFSPKGIAFCHLKDSTFRPKFKYMYPLPRAPYSRRYA